MQGGGHHVQRQLKPLPKKIDPKTQEVIDYWLSHREQMKRQQGLFLAEFEQCGLIYVSARRARISKSTILLWRKIDPEFAQAVDEAKEYCIDRVQQTAYELAVNERHPLLVMFYLKAHRPEFRDKLTIDLPTVQAEIEQHLDELGIDDNQLQQLLVNEMGKEGSTGLQLAQLAPGSPGGTPTDS